MCKAFSAICLKSGEVIWQMDKDSHEELVILAHVKDDIIEKDELQFARIEISPRDNNYLNPHSWEFSLDESIKPSWWNDNYEKECWKAHKTWLIELNKILIKKPIVNPFDIVPPKKIIEKHLDLLKQWASVRDSVRASVRASVWDSVRASVGTSVGASVRASVGGSVWASVGDSVGTSVRASVWDSAWAYVGSFFNLPRKAWKYTEKIECKNYPFQPAIDLWMMGLVPSFDGNIWRLHGGREAKVLWEGI